MGEGIDLWYGYRSDEDENNENNDVVLGDCLGGSELIRRARQENLWTVYGRAIRKITQIWLTLDKSGGH